MGRGTDPTCVLNFERLMLDISSGRWKSKIEKCREILQRDGKKKYKEYRSENVPHFASHVIMNTRARCIDSLRCKGYTGLVQLDFDLLSESSMDRIKLIGLSDPSVVSMYVSPSGAGIKIHLHVPEATDRDEFKLIAMRAEKYCLQRYGVEPELVTLHDVVRLCAVSYDKDLFYNSKSIPVPVDFSYFY